MSVEPFFERIESQMREEFQQAERVLSFAQYMEAVAKNPRVHLRTAPQYLVDLFDSYGRRDATRIGRDAVRHRVFDRSPDRDEPLLAGQEAVQDEIYSHLLSAAKRGKVQKMLLLHGPNGSGKTTVVDCIISALETYSRTPSGAMFKFNWIFTDREARLDRIGFETSAEEVEEELDTYATLDGKDVAAKIPCEMRDSPLFLIPRSLRADIVGELVDNVPEEFRPRFSYDVLLEGGLCQKCQEIFETLLVAYKGDWRQVVRHIQVERTYISKRYRSGAVSIEPQGNVDAGARLIQHESAYNLPAVLQNVSLYEPFGDIIDANRGLLEYSDFLKRPIETNKYLLTTCERGTVSLGNCAAYLDVFIIGTSNEKHLNLFKRSPDFSSFKGRIDLVAVPYLLRYSVEAELYERQISLYTDERHVAPHTAKVAALWAVLTRMRRPDPERYSGALAKAVAQLSPVDKALLYDSGEPPARLSDEDRRALRVGLIDIRSEYDDLEGEFEGIFGLEYEGRRGASPREMMSILSRAAGNRRTRCVTPMAVFSALEELLRDSGLYDYLRIEPEGEYHDVEKFLSDVRDAYLGWVTEEVYDSIELVDEAEYDRVFEDYFRHAKASQTGEKMFNPATDRYEEPNEELMDSIEKLLDLKVDRSKFRSQVITRIAAWSLDHPDEKLHYQELFAEIYGAMRDNFYKERNRLLTLIEEDILKYGTDEFELLSDSDKAQVERALVNMRDKYHYCEICARDVIAFVLRCRKEAERAAAAATEAAEAADAESEADEEEVAVESGE